MTTTATQWLGLTTACVLSGVTANQLYRLAAIGRVGSRRVRGRLQFSRRDLERLRDERTVASARVTVENR